MFRGQQEDGKWTLPGILEAQNILGDAWNPPEPGARGAEANLHECVIRSGLHNWTRQRQRLCKRRDDVPPKTVYLHSNPGIRLRTLKNPRGFADPRSYPGGWGFKGSMGVVHVGEEAGERPQAPTWTRLCAAWQDCLVPLISSSRSPLAAEGSWRRMPAPLICRQKPARVSSRFATLLPPLPLPRDTSSPHHLRHLPQFLPPVSPSSSRGATLQPAPMPQGFLPSPHRRLLRAAV